MQNLKPHIYINLSLSLILSGLLAKKAVAAGLTVAPYIKTSLSPGSGVVSYYLKESGVCPALIRLGFDVVGYGCMTCIGNSGPLPDSMVEAIEKVGCYMIWFYWPSLGEYSRVYCFMCRVSLSSNLEVFGNLGTVIFFYWQTCKEKIVSIGLLNLYWLSSI